MGYGAPSLWCCIFHCCISAQRKGKFCNCGKGEETGPVERIADTTLLIIWGICPCSINLKSPETLGPFFLIASADDLCLQFFFFFFFGTKVYLINLSPCGLFVNSGWDILWADPAPPPHSNYSQRSVLAPSLQFPLL